jgi:hypothetical protein
MRRIRGEVRGRKGSSGDVHRPPFLEISRSRLEKEEKEEHETSRSGNTTPLPRR